MDFKDTQPVLSKPAHVYRFQESAQIAERYEVVAPLGHGGFAEVYHCQDLRLRRDVTVKVLTERGVGLEEAQAAARLKHPHIVQIYDALTSEDDVPLIVFDYVGGETLETRLNEAQYRRLPLGEESLRIIRQVSEALDYAHGQGITHRDIKPSNIILDHQGNAHLTDFGLAMVKSPPGRTPVHGTYVSGRLSGSVPYMAPEQLKGGRPGDKRSDLYSLGVVVYEMLTGQFPYRGRDTQLIAQILSGRPLPPRQANPELPKGVEPVLLRVLDKDPEQRYSSCQDLAGELEETAQAFVAALDQYEQAQELVRAGQWRQALAALQALERQSPGFRDVAHQLEQAGHQVRLLELYEKAQGALAQAEYQGALDTLNVLAELDPDHDVADLRQRAREGMAQEERRTLDEQYQQAVQQFREGDFQACLDTLAVIRERDAGYPDLEGIEAPALERVQGLRRLRELYARGVEQVNQERWDEAIATFQELQERAPDYEDVGNRLAMARHLGRMSAMWKEAREFFAQEEFAACVDKLDDLRRVDANYEREKVSALRQEGLDGMYGKADRLLQQGEFEASLTILADLRRRSPNYANLDALEAQVREAMQARDLRARLDDLYLQAVTHLRQRDFIKALRVWERIQQSKGGLDYADPQDVEGRARDGLCASLYSQALGALSQGNPQQALELWGQVADVDAYFPDSQGVRRQAREMMAQQKEASERRRRWPWAVIIVGGGGVLLLLLILFATGVFSSSSPEATATPTLSPSPMPTAPLAPTALPEPTDTSPPPPTRAPTHTPTREPTAMPTSSSTPTSTEALQDLATAMEPSSVFEAPRTGSRELAFVGVGEQVTVLGRAPSGDWFYVRDDQGVEGFAYAPRFAWSGDFESLPAVTPPPTTTSLPAVTPPTSTPPPEGAYPALSIDFWHLPGTERCGETAWYQSVWIQGQGGDGNYTYYRDGEFLAGPLIYEGYAFEVSSSSGSIILAGKVVSGDGQEATREIYIPEPDCTP